MGEGWHPIDGPAPDDPPPRPAGGTPPDTTPSPFTTAPPHVGPLPPHVDGVPTTESARPFSDPPYSGPSHPLPGMVPPIRATVSPGGGRNRTWVWVLAAVAAVLAVAYVAYVAVIRPIDDAMDQLEPERMVPPEEVSTTLPPLDPEDAALYDEVRCRFSGSSTVEPGVRISDDLPTPQRMELLPGAAFDCVSPEGRTTGAIRLTTEMPSMNAFRGEGTATGVIDWSSVGPGVPEELGRTSHLTAEVELAYPNVILLFTIQDGPWAGYKGRVVLAKWTFQHDAQGRIVQVDFEPTDVVLSDG